MTINVNHLLGGPLAVNDRVSTNQNTPVSFTILTNDTNVDGTITNTSIDLDPLTDGQQSTITIPGQGTFTNNGTGTITFTPVSDFYGNTSEITYTVQNSILRFKTMQESKIKYGAKCSNQMDAIKVFL